MTGGPCPRCGRAAPPGVGPFCPYCGRYRVPVAWVALPPPGPRPVPPRPHPPYTGPPRYAAVPRWGFRPGPWRTGGDPGPDPVAGAVRALAVAVPLLWAAAAVAALAAAGEGWRYVLLVHSRAGALDGDVVAASDALVGSAGVLAPVAAVAAGAAAVVWAVRALAASAARAGVRPARDTRAVVVGCLVPGLSLVVPGAVLAEIEHAALARPPDVRPRPSRLLLGWWVLWAGGGLLAAVTLAWGLRDGVQARADGVLLHLVLDLLAAAVAVLSTVVLTRLTRLLDPGAGARRLVLVGLGARSSGADPELPVAAHDEVRAPV